MKKILFVLFFAAGLSIKAAGLRQLALAPVRNNNGALVGGNYAGRITSAFPGSDVTPGNALLVALANKDYKASLTAISLCTTQAVASNAGLFWNTSSLPVKRAMWDKLAEEEVDFSRQQNVLGWANDNSKSEDEQVKSLACKILELQEEQAERSENLRENQ